MEWYIPITIIPGIGMLVLSTTNQMMSLSQEIERLLTVKCTSFIHDIIDLKIKQLSKLTSATTLLYIAAALFVFSGIFGALSQQEQIGQWILIAGVGVTFLALALLIVYSFKAIKIRKKQHQENLKSLESES